MVEMTEAELKELELVLQIKFQEKCSIEQAIKRYLSWRQVWLRESGG